MKHDIQSDGETVWVHLQGETVGRFGKLGIDIHTTVKQQMEGQPSCLYCTHSTTTLDQWRKFQELMRDTYGIDIDNSFTPNRFKSNKDQQIQNQLIT